jgi:hypothetical protein
MNVHFDWHGDETPRMMKVVGGNEAWERFAQNTLNA